MNSSSTNNAVILMVRTVSKILKERLGSVGENMRLSRGVIEPEEELGKYGEKNGIRNEG